jgi:Skp family chaperone for outer membrane proteins
MKKSITALLVAGSLLMGTAMAAPVTTSAPQYGVVNYMSVFQQVPQGNDTLNGLKADLKPKVDALKVEQAKLEQQMQTLDRNAPTMSQDARDAQEKQLTDQQTAFQQQVEALQKVEAQKERAAADHFNTVLQDAIQQVATKNHLLLVFNGEATPYVDPSLDVTAQVVAIMKTEK